MRGALTGNLPTTIKVGNKEIPIYTDWRVWVDVWRLIDNPHVDDDKKMIALFALIFPRTGESQTPFEQALEQAEDAITASLLFLNRKRIAEQERPKTAREKRLGKKRLLDWDYDAEKIIADFEREYRLDLTNPDTCLHWWRFMALFSGLSDRSQIMDAISTRAQDLNDRKLSKDQKKALRERKIAVMLPARTQEEANDNRRLRGY